VDRPQAARAHSRVDRSGIAGGHFLHHRCAGSWSSEAPIRSTFEKFMALQSGRANGPAYDVTLNVARDPQHTSGSAAGGFPVGLSSQAVRVGLRVGSIFGRRPRRVTSASARHEVGVLGVPRHPVHPGAVSASGIAGQ